MPRDRTRRSPGSKKIRPQSLSNNFQRSPGSIFLVEGCFSMAKSSLCVQVLHWW